MWQEIKNIYHLAEAVLANVWYRFPSRKLAVIGVTGTDGKTTTVNLIYHILKEAGLNVSMISTVKAVIGKDEYDTGFHVTTPSPWFVQRLLADALRKTNQNSIPNKSAKFSVVARNVQLSSVLVLEVTSHALDQFRVWGVDFEIGVLTNVTHEHLDYHKTYEKYVKTKAKLLRNSKTAIINKDDESFKSIMYYVSSIKYKGKVITYGLNSDSDVNIKNFPFKTNLIGEFNKYNCLAAISACRELGVEDEIIRKALLTFKSPLGRQDIVFNKDFRIMIDFAHTPNAIDQILSSIKKNTKGRVVHVFGSAGERDVEKRPLMGKMSSKYADVIILTSEDPRSESVEKIMEQILSGINPKSEIRNPKQIKNSKFKIQNKKKYILKIPDRQEAINTAINMAKKGDFVVVTGKGHEKSMNYGKGEVAWSDYEAVKRALELKVSKVSKGVS